MLAATLSLVGVLAVAIIALFTNYALKVLEAHHKWEYHLKELQTKTMLEVQSVLRELREQVSKGEYRPGTPESYRLPNRYQELTFLVGDRDLRGLMEEFDLLKFTIAKTVDGPPPFNEFLFFHHIERINLRIGELLRSPGETPSIGQLIWEAVVPHRC